MCRINISTHEGKKIYFECSLLGVSEFQSLDTIFENFKQKLQGCGPMLDEQELRHIVRKMYSNGDLEKEGSLYRAVNKKGYTYCRKAGS